MCGRPEEYIYANGKFSLKMETKTPPNDFKTIYPGLYKFPYNSKVKKTQFFVGLGC